MSGSPTNPANEGPHNDRFTPYPRADDRCGRDRGSGDRGSGDRGSGGRAAQSDSVRTGMLAHRANEGAQDISYRRPNRHQKIKELSEANDRGSETAIQVVGHSAKYR